MLRGGGDAAPVELPGRMVVVDCEKASRKLLQVSGDLRKGALQRVESTLGKLASTSPPIESLFGKTLWLLRHGFLFACLATLWFFE